MISISTATGRPMTNLTAELSRRLLADLPLPEIASVICANWSILSRSSGRMCKGQESFILMERVRAKLASDELSQLDESRTDGVE